MLWFNNASYTNFMMHENEQLMERAKKASEYSYSPYSKFRVGAALLCKDGKIFTGTHVENASYGMTMCAERVAIFKAISEGCSTFTDIAIVSDSKKLYKNSKSLDIKHQNLLAEYFPIDLCNIFPYPTVLPIFNNADTLSTIVSILPRNQNAS